MVVATIVGISKTKVVIPPWPHHNFASIRIFLFVEIGAQSIRIDILCDFIGEIHVNERLRLDECFVAKFVIRKIRACQSVFELGEMVLDVSELERVQIVCLGFVHLNKLLVASQTGVR